MANTETTINAVIHPKYNDTPIDIEKTIKALERNNFVVHYFETGTEAISYLKDRIQNKHVAIGDSRTLLKLNAYEALSEVNEDVTDIQRPLPGESFRDTALRTMGRDVFLTSVNALAQTGSQEVFFVLGINKITPDLASAIYRARNVAAPLNSKKNKKSSLNPCATLEEKCYDCGSPDRICNALTIYYKKMRNMQTMEVIIINESLGF
ncbi:MAG: LUD domain-containing protein [Veillonella sp.]|nr:LUD domain-containing protein [Veillonella sp.]